MEKTPAQLEEIYTEDIPDYGDLMTVEKYKEMVDCGMFTDYDGHGEPVRDGMIASGHFAVIPSQLHKLRSDATHIVWFNR